MTPKKRAGVMRALLEIVHSSDCDARDRISAARALLAADKQNAPRIEQPVASNHLHLHVEPELLAERKRIAAEMLSQLGFDVVGAGEPTDSQVVDATA